MANSKRKCKNCGERVRDYIVINNVAYCSFESAVQYASNNKLKGAEIKRKSADKEFRARKKSFRLSDTKKQHDLTQIAFNKLRVLQEKKWFTDKGLEPECISCGKQNMDWCCGHFKSRGAQSNLRYDVMNTYLQCNRYCNMGLSGNIEGNKTTRGYKQGLVDRFGKDRAQEILDYCETNTAVRKFTGPELERMRKEFNSEIKKLLQ